MVSMGPRPPVKSAVTPASTTAAPTTPKTLAKTNGKGKGKGKGNKRVQPRCLEPEAKEPEAEEEFDAAGRDIYYVAANRTPDGATEYRGLFLSDLKSHLHQWKHPQNKHLCTGSPRPRHELFLLSGWLLTHPEDDLGAGFLKGVDRAYTKWRRACNKLKAATNDGGPVDYASCAKKRWVRVGTGARDGLGAEQLEAVRALALPGLKPAFCDDKHCVAGSLLNALALGLDCPVDASVLRQLPPHTDLKDLARDMRLHKSLSTFTLRKAHIARHLNLDQQLAVVEQLDAPLLVRVELSDDHTATHAIYVDGRRRQVVDPIVNAVLPLSASALHALGIERFMETRVVARM